MRKGTRKTAFLVGVTVLLAAIIVVVLTLRFAQRKRHRRNRLSTSALKLPKRGLSGKPVPAGSRGPSDINVVLVSVDTERADYTTPYGELHDTTPFLSELAKQGITFKNVFSTSSWTVPAMYSLITGLYPTEHGIQSGTTQGQGDGRRVKGQEILPDAANTLAEELHKAGYSSFGINTNYHLRASYGFAQGFDRYAGELFSFLPYPNMMVASLAQEIRGAGKTFVWLHYFDPHFPYRGIAPWFDQWNQSKFGNNFQFSEEMTKQFFRKYAKLAPEEPIDPGYIDILFEATKLLSGHQGAITYGLNYLSPNGIQDYLEFIKQAYRSEIRLTDEAIRDAFGELGVDDQTLVVYTADHGEELFEHNRVGHRHSLYQELIHVPLVIRLPNGAFAGKIIEDQVSLVDIVPTILDILDLPIPDNLSGVSLKPLIEGEGIPSRLIYCEVKNRYGDSKCIIDYPWKYIYNYTNKNRELYHLGSDPGEKDNLAFKQKVKADSMHKTLIEWSNSTEVHWKPGEGKTLTPQEIKQLRRMGYIQ